MRLRPGLKEIEGKKKKKSYILSLLARETMGNITLNIQKLNTQIINFRNRKKDLNTQKPEIKHIERNGKRCKSKPEQV